MFISNYASTVINITSSFIIPPLSNFSRFLLFNFPPKEDEILALGGDSDLLDIDHELVASIENELFLRKVQARKKKTV